ncbi:MAG TPA: hypothetical protein VFJ68_02480 [Casimicrobiaceae bacterium]|nr:hypothetical protein [Casimicrobiaceae bacterium]
MSRGLRFAGSSAFAVALLGGTAFAQTGDKPEANPTAVLAAAKTAAGGAAWDGHTSLHTLVALRTGGHTGEAERWSEIRTGRSYMRFELGPMAGVMGFDGNVAWTQEPSGKTRLLNVDTDAQLAVNAAYRDQLAFWFPDRHPAKFVYKGHSPADGADFDVIGVTPEGGREFELWVNVETKMIERLVEHEAIATRTEIYMDWRDVQGVRLPFRVRASRGDPKADEIVVIERVEFDGPLDDVPFARPAP